MIIMIPLMQLVLFGYAINTNPRNLPTAVLLQEHSDLARSILAALQNTKYFKVTALPRNEAELDRLLLSGQVLFAVEIPANFERAVRRGDDPAMLVAADGTDPVASGSALGALDEVVQSALDHDHGLPQSGTPPFRDPHPCPLQPRRLEPAQHRARPGRHHPHHDHADLHRLVGDARDRARHHGKPARHADHAARDHARQDRALCAGRLRAGGADRRRRHRLVRRAADGQPDALGAVVDAVHHRQSGDRLYLLDHRPEPVAGDADVADVLFAEYFVVRFHVPASPACRPGRSGSARRCR